VKILTAGGGSGGHVTPIAAVISEIIKEEPKAEIRCWTDFKFYKPAKRILSNSSRKVKTTRIVSGKLRRYNGFGVTTYIKNPSIIILNIRDGFLVAVGFVQCLIKLLLWRPDVIFLKGGYVCLPIGLVARLFNIPFVIHDSDTVPGLTNRILAQYASRIATGMPLENYSYPDNKTFYIGIPTSDNLHPISSKEQSSLKTKFGLNPKKPVVLVTGGGLGAMNINEAILKNADELLAMTSIILITGIDNYQSVKQQFGHKHDQDLKLYDFVPNGLREFLGVADIVIARAGATSIAELAICQKTVIMIPNAQLPGGHQSKNAEYLTKKRAVLAISDDEICKSDILTKTISKLLKDKDLADRLAVNLNSLSRPDAARDMAKLVLDTIRR
jgi:UDP-N-acetylglucosamine:LPS N-acetylglucosamine transferase